MTDRPSDDTSSNASYKPLDWNADVYTDRAGTKHFINKGELAINECGKNNALSNFPKADELLAFSSCVQDQRAKFEKQMNEFEAQSIESRLPNRMLEAGQKGEKQVTIVNLDSPQIPDHLNPMLKKLQDNGYKTALVHSLSGEEVQQNKPIPGLQSYRLIAKFEK